jgi:methionyl-tRNA formyltransferase
MVMRVVFLGTPAFAVSALQSLSKHSYEIRGVFTQPDRPSGRGQRLQPSPVKALAQTLKIPVFQPDRIRAEENRAVFEDLRPDFIVVVAYGQILPQWLLESARLGAINIHASLLPRYRGAAPVVWAILNGEAVTGITTMMMVEKLDAGPILLQKEVPIPFTKTAGELAEELSMVGADLLIKTLEGLAAKTLNPAAQDETQVSWAPRISKEMARISWENRAVDIHNQIRAMNPWPIAYTVFRNERLQILQSLPESSPVSSNAAPGTFLGFSDKGVRVQCGESTILELLKVKAPAKKRISGREFAAGVRLHAGERIF